MNQDALDSLLAKGRLRLNRIYIMDRLAVTLSWVGGITGTALLILHLSGWPGATWLCWVGLTIPGGIFGFISGWRRRLDLEKTAQWLDDYLKDRQALAAALECMKHGGTGRFDEAVIRRARDIAAEDRTIHWPTHRLLRQAGITLAVFIGISLLFLVKIPGLPDYGNPAARSDQTGAVGQNRRSTAGLRSGLAVQSAHTAAEMLFPENPAMAAAAERAIREGNTDLLEQLLKEAQLEIDKDLNLAQNSSTTEQERLRSESQKRQRMIDSLSSQGSNLSNSRESSGRPGQDHRGEDGEIPGSSRNQSNPGNQYSGGERPIGNNPQPGPYQPGQTIGGGPQGPGQQAPLNSETGSGLSGKGGPGRQPGAERDWGKVAAANSGQQLVISQSKPGAMLELVLPGKNITVPLSEALPDWRRAAEAALSREGVPGEYQDFVRAYFLELSQETMGDMPESGDQK